MATKESMMTVIIPTQNRADSLRVTLDCLANANRDGIQAEIIVVDNGGQDGTKDVVASFSHKIPIRYLYEPTVGVHGKSHALNRALDAGGLGDIIVVLDDDMSPNPNWFQAVAAISKRWPDKDLFTGHTFTIWPYESVPSWAKKKTLQSWLFSAVHLGKSDEELKDGRWFSGNHFWFRSRVLEGGRRFKDMWVTEPDFQLDLVEQGFSGIASPEAIAGHRIQPALLQRDVLLRRARKTGVCGAWLRLQPYRNRVKHARLLHQHPWLGRLFCILNHWRWCFLYLVSFVYPSGGSRFEYRLIAVERMAIYRELLRAANRLEAYSLWKRLRSAAQTGTGFTRDMEPGRLPSSSSYWRA